ncbi:MAG: ATP-dependent helicase [Chloroflexi bacterium]|nr:ATP-dependent helicase [Chloroflexota bacterium]
MDWRDGLDDKARRIAGSDQSPLRVVAGPGTGKTFSLIRRVARLLQEGAKPDAIFACSFTRTGANDLHKELLKLAMPNTGRVQSGTLHSFCFRLLRRAEVLQLTGRVPRPLMKFEQRFLLEDLRRGTFGGVRDCNRRLEAFNSAWARLQSDEPGWPTDPTDRAFQSQLLSWLQFQEAMLVGELIPEALRFLRGNPASPFRPRFAHVLVDEYQDLNRAEQALLDLLANGGTLTVVGDEDQSIYSFKYAHPEGISAFDQTHPATADESLDECRRCPITVVEMANHLIQYNPARSARILVPLAGAPPGEVFVVQWSSLDGEVEGIAKFVDTRVKAADVEAGGVLILSPRRQLGYRIRDALNNMGTRAHSFFHEEALDGNPKELGASQAQQAFVLLTLLANPDDRVALRSWCGFGSDSLRKNGWARLRAHCESTGESPREALDRIVAGQVKLPYTGDIVARYCDAMKQVAHMADLRGQDLLDAVFPSADWSEPFRFIGASIRQQDYDSQLLLEETRIAVTQPELPTDVDYVRVMSLHKSKGLTADLVVIVGCIEGLIPFIDDDLPPADSERSLHEQRRLFYVAITRTRQTLVISSFVRLPRDLAHRMGAPVRGGGPTEANTIASQFIDELGPRKPDTISGDDFFH